MAPVLVKRGVAEKSSCATSGVFACSLLMTAFHSLPSSCVWWASSLMTSSCPARRAMRSAKSMCSIFWAGGLDDSCAWLENLRRAYRTGVTDRQWGGW